MFPLRSEGTILCPYLSTIVPLFVNQSNFNLEPSPMGRLSYPCIGKPCPNHKLQTNTLTDLLPLSAFLPSFFCNLFSLFFSSLSFLSFFFFLFLSFFSFDFFSSLHFLERSFCLQREIQQSHLKSPSS